MAIEMQTSSGTEGAKRAQRSASLRTALILVSIAAVFFGGIIASQYTGGNAVGIGVLGFAIIGFLLVTVGRGLRGGSRKTETGPK
jgi:hypothetical protein